MKLLLGADPEVFYSQAGQFVSAYGLIPGTKENPHLVADGAVQVDGMALEFNINPAEDSSQWVNNIHSVMGQLAALVPDGSLEAVPIATFGAEYIAAQPDEAKLLGCDPDYNGWSGRENVTPDVTLPFRTGAGHVHLGWTEGEDIYDPEHLGMCEALIKQLDFYLGLPSLLVDPCVKRREMYGKAGAYRPKSYGLEYRVLSNFWLGSDDLMLWVYNQTKKAFDALDSGDYIFQRHEDIQHIINTSDVDAARAIIEAEGLEVPHVS